MKRIISILMMLVLLVSFAGCTKYENMPKPTYPEYENIESVNGYMVRGYVLDKNGGGLPGAKLYIGKELKAVCDDTGYYEIKGLSGTNEIKPEFYEYKFDVEKIVVNTSTYKSFYGKIEFSINLSSKLDGSLPLYGVKYIVNGEEKNENDQGYVTVEKLTGKTTITPQRAGFTFEPASTDVYYGTSVNFKAVPNDGTFAVSGTINMIGVQERMTSLKIFVDGVKYSIITMEYDETGKVSGYNFSVTGLSTKTSGSYIRVGSPEDGYLSIEPYQAKTATDKATLTVAKARKLNVTKESGANHSAIRVKYSNGTTYEKPIDFVDGIAKNVVIFLGCIIEVNVNGTWRQINSNESTIISALYPEKDAWGNPVYSPNLTYSVNVN